MLNRQLIVLFYKGVTESPQTRHKNLYITLPYTNIAAIFWKIVSLEVDAQWDFRVTEKFFSWRLTPILWLWLVVFCVLQLCEESKVRELGWKCLENINNY